MAKDNSLRLACTRAEGGDDLEVGAGCFCDELGGSVVDGGGEVDEVGAYAESLRAGFEEGFGSLLGDAAGGDELEMREGREDGLEVASAAHGRAGEDFDVVRAFFPGGDDLGGGECAGDGDLFVLFGPLL